MMLLIWWERKMPQGVQEEYAVVPLNEEEKTALEKLLQEKVAEGKVVSWSFEPIGTVKVTAAALMQRVRDI